jgi:hypothetical protein
MRSLPAFPYSKASSPMAKRLEFHWISAKQFMSQEQQKLTLGSIDRLSRELLDWIMVRAQSEQELFIQEIVMESEIASPATVHKSLDVLSNAGLIELAVDESDHRRRLVRPTDLALEELKALEKSFQAWIRKTAL